MIIPWSTDAPIYHWPIATAGLIAANVLAFIALGDGTPEAIEAWSLAYGSGLHPLQWVSSIFVHAGFMHLIGNMIFLWSFGIVVEGKLGWWKFLAVYLGIGVLQSALEQLAMLGASEGYSCGASAAIFGLMAICMVWAPKNEMSCVLLLGFRVRTFDMPILALALLFLAFEVVEAVFWGVALPGFGGHRVATAILHLSGGLIGFGAGVGMLKAGLVDCENWDLFAMLSNRLGVTEEQARHRASRSLTRPEPDRESPARGEGPRKTAEERAAAEEDRMRRRIEEGDSAGALASYQKAIKFHPGWNPPEADRLALIKALHVERAWEASIPPMEDYLRDFPERSSRMRLKLAQILIHEQRRPIQGAKVLAEIPAGSLPEALETVRSQLVAEAARLSEEGVLELEGEAW